MGQAFIVRTLLNVAFVCLAVPLPRADTWLQNPGFEEREPNGSPSGWTVQSGLDLHGYGEPLYTLRFDALQPAVVAGGLHSPHCLGFPAEGSWECPVFQHSNGDGIGIDGKSLGKAVARQTVRLPKGRYRFRVWLRTADGVLFAGAFSLGVSLGPHVAYAHDGSTGIIWTQCDLALRTGEIGDVRRRGEWAPYETAPFALDRDGSVTVWIRFHYANENQMRARWQADNAAIVPDVSPSAGVWSHPPCAPLPRPVRYRTVCGVDEPYLVNVGVSEIVDASHIRLFRRARLIPAGSTVEYHLPPGAEINELLIIAGGRGTACVATVPSGEVPFAIGSADPRRPAARAFSSRDLPQTSTRFGSRLLLHAASTEPLVLYEIEAGNCARTQVRLRHVEYDVVRVHWIIGVWDGTSHEFEELGNLASEGVHTTAPLGPQGRWSLVFHHAPIQSHRYLLVHGLLGGRGAIDIGADGIPDWVAETKGEEIVDFDVTDLLASGDNNVVLDAGNGRHDFAALIELCPGATDVRALRLAFEGTPQAERLSRVADNTWFWLRELHYEPNGFVDASVPHGHWYGQYWPVDIGFALREWVRWGYHEESVRIAQLVAALGWAGHTSNRSGGSDNTGGYILALELIEALLRADYAPDLRDAVWSRIRTHAAEVVAAASASPFGLIRGTNWENAGNREHGPCYALSTNLGAAASLLKAASLAQTLGEPVLADSWRATAYALRAAVLRHLVLQADHTTPSGFVLPKGTWAYGLRTDGSIEDQPLAGYLWAGAVYADVYGLRYDDPPLRTVYARTLEAAVPLFARNQPGIVSGYSISYDGADSTLVTLAALDHINLYDPVLECLAGENDAEDRASSLCAELSRWAHGGPGGTEDTNLVCAAGMLWALRALVGLDDLLAGGQQLSLSPRLPWHWSGMRINGWPVRYRAADGSERWTSLSAHLARSDTSAALEVRTLDPVPGLAVRLGPFSLRTERTEAFVDGTSVVSQPSRSGDAAWVWLHVNSTPKGTRVQVLAQ